MPEGDEKKKPEQIVGVGAVNIKKRILERLKKALQPFVDEVDKLTAEDEIDSPLSLEAHLAIVFCDYVTFVEDVKSHNPKVIFPFLAFVNDFMAEQGIRINMAKIIKTKSGEKGDKDLTFSVPGNDEVH